MNDSPVGNGMKNQREDSNYRHLQDEFVRGVTDPFKLDQLPPISRKKFLALMSATAAFAVTGCTNYRDRGEIVPYRNKPEEVNPGIPTYYASTCDMCNQVCGILIKTREGRPIKIEGNPDHPVNAGKICSKGQLSILNLYDPYRLKNPIYVETSDHTKDLNWSDVDKQIIESLKSCELENKEIAVIAPLTFSPSGEKVFAEFQKSFHNTKIYMYSIFNDSARRKAWKLCYGNSNPVIPDWEKARILVLLEADVLGTEGMTVEQTRKIIKNRSIDKLSNFNRIYCIEGSLSLTGVQADYRIRLRTDFDTEFALLLLKEVSKIMGVNNKEIEKMVADLTISDFCKKHKLSESVIKKLVNDIIKYRDETIIYAGDSLPESTHIIVNYLNHLLNTKVLHNSISIKSGMREISDSSDFMKLVEKMKNGEVGVIIHIDTNPVYHLPVSMGYANALEKVPVRISLTESENETSAVCNYVLPIHNALESWGDFKERFGIYSLRQPVVEPLYNSRQKEAVLLTWIYGHDKYKSNIYQEFLNNNWRETIYPSSRAGFDFKSFWYSSLHDGVIQVEESVKFNSKFNKEAIKSVQVPKENHGMTVLLKESHFIGDGRLANNGWLQELPHPITKVVWDNYASISSETARKYGIKNGENIEIQNENGSIVIPVIIQPGQADNFLAIEIGYGRWKAGPIGSDVGTNVNPLLAEDWLQSPRLIKSVTIKKAVSKTELVSTQEHHSLNDSFVKDFHLKRKIIQEGSIQEYQTDPDFLKKHHTELPGITKRIKYTGVKWAMAIDLNKCTGCSACVASCNVENNIPVVGKDQVARGREMHWIRIDRYYSGTDDNLKVSFQPMLCQHCDNAPCENVCPVVATNHSPDGLNQMVYNRCVGTKYCSNNCPYKVRRFNFFDWRDYLADGYYEKEPVSLLSNPDVTVRSRGVMEKCTFCIQRIMNARQKAVEEGRSLKGSDVRTACQDACPSSAIIFGDMNDPDSEVSSYIRHNLGYHVLEEVNALPNIIYIAKLRNIDQADMA